MEAKTRLEKFMERFEDRTKDIRYPDVPSPKDDPPSIEIDLAELHDHEISQNLDAWVRWQAYFETATGHYASAEEALKQELARTKREVYLKLHRDGSFKGQVNAYKELLVEEDAAVVDLEDRLAEVRSGHKLARHYRETYNAMVIRYYSERKSRDQRDGLPSFGRS